MKVVLLGMNSPTGRVLEYDRANSAGGRLLKLSGMSPMVYTLCFQRMNVLKEPTWNRESAKRAGSNLRSKFGREGRTVVALGREVWKALGLEEIDWLGSTELNGATFYLIPHTSGLCHWYNDLDNCVLAQRLLKKLARIDG